MLCCHLSIAGSGTGNHAVDAGVHVHVHVATKLIACSHSTRAAVRQMVVGHASLKVDPIVSTFPSTSVIITELIDNRGGDYYVTSNHSKLVYRGG